MPGALIVTESKTSRGFALTIVLWIVIALSLIAIGIVHLNRSDQTIAQAAEVLAQAQESADAGVTRGIMALLDRDPTHSWRIDGTPQSWSFADAKVQISIEDELGKIDLNAASDSRLHDLFLSTGVSEDEAETLVDTIADWRDQDDLKRLHGAEKDDYAAAGLPYGPRNGLFESVDELGQILGMPAQVLERVRPALTVFSHLPVPDPSTAPAAVLAVLPSIGPNGIEAALAARGHAVNDTDTSATPTLLGTTSTITDLTGRAFTLHAIAQMPDGTRAERIAVIRFTDGAHGKYWIQDWR